MQIFGITFHFGVCPIKTKYVFSCESVYSPELREIKAGHKQWCARVKYPSSLHLCDCGLEETKGSK